MLFNILDLYSFCTGAPCKLQLHVFHYDSVAIAPCITIFLLITSYLFVMRCLNLFMYFFRLCLTSAFL
jgi:hypothetical protein